jgi:azobenzene reductase
VSAPPINILLVCGSGSRLSHTCGLLRIVQAGLEALGAETVLYDLSGRDLPPPDGLYHGRASEHPDERVREIARLATSADAFVLGSPVYHNSYSGILKIFLDHLAIPDFAGKPVGLVGNGGRLRSFQACDHLRVVARGLHAFAIPEQVVTADSDFAYVDGAYRLSNRELSVRIARFIRELMTVAERLRQAPAAESIESPAEAAMPAQRAVARPSPARS